MSDRFEACFGTLESQLDSFQDEIHGIRSKISALERRVENVSTSFYDTTKRLVLDYTNVTCTLATVCLELICFNDKVDFTVYQQDMTNFQMKNHVLLNDMADLRSEVLHKIATLRKDMDSLPVPNSHAPRHGLAVDTEGMTGRQTSFERQILDLAKFIVSSNR
jgi:hypothetical protein